MCSKTIPWLSPLLAALWLLGAPAVALAQEAPPELPPATGESAFDSADLMGVIPGTNMLRDEFRARALLQLKALALNALAYRIVHDDQYTSSFYELKRSAEWNLDLSNMFTGRPVQAIYFEPREGDMTTRPVFDLPILVEDLPSASGGFGGGETGDGQDGGSGLDLGGGDFSPPAVGIVTRARVDPTRITHFTGGDVFYYADGELLQLVLFAPDGSYLEYVDETPNMHWRRQLESPEVGLWPDSVYASQLLYFAHDLLPQHYNLVQFMGDREWLAPAQFGRVGAAERIALAEALGVTMINPATREPIVLSAEFGIGDFAEPDPQTPVPLRIWLRDREAWSLEELRGGSPSAFPEEVPAAGGDSEGPPSAPPRPPLGGRD